MYALTGVSPSLAVGEGRRVMVYTVMEPARSTAQWLLWQGLLGCKLLSTAAAGIYSKVAFVLNYTS
jgi:hypothetical protein